MNRKFFWIALAALVFPILLRSIWLFPGFTFPRAIATPDYSNLKMPLAPISTPQAVTAKDQGGTVIVDYAHTNQFQANEIQTLTDALNLRGAQVNFDSDATLLASNLKSASAYIVISPATAFTSEEILHVRDFVSQGGRLAVFTDATRGQVLYDIQGNPIGNTPDVIMANPLLEPFGIAFNADYLYNLVENEGNFRNVYFQSFGKSDLTRSINKIALYGTHSVETDTGLALLVGSDKTLSSSTDTTPGNDPQKGWAAAVLSKDGNVFAAGDITFLSPPYNTVGDNATLINNIADFLLGGKRKVTLADFPYIFSGTSVDVLATTNVQMTAGVTNSLSKLQTALAATNTELNVVTEAPLKGNVIVLGTFSPTDSLTTYIDSFNLKLDEFSEFVNVPQFGKIGRSGNGLLLFNYTDQGTTLVLLADTPDDVSTLLDTLSSGDLSGCLLQADVGVCSIGSGGSFSLGDTSTPSIGGSLTPEATPYQKTPPVTATPSG